MDMMCAVPSHSQQTGQHDLAKVQAGRQAAADSRKALACALHKRAAFDKRVATAVYLSCGLQSLLLLFVAWPRQCGILGPQGQVA